MTPAYRVEIEVEGFYFTPAAWPTKDAGRPSDANLAAYVKVLEDSTREGGVNAHLGVTTVRSAQIVRQADAEIVASF